MVKIIRVEKGSEYAKQLLRFVENCSWHEVKEHIAEMLRNWSFTDWECMFAAMEDGKITGMASLMKTDYYPPPRYIPVGVMCLRFRGIKRPQDKRSAH